MTTPPNLPPGVTLDDERELIDADPPEFIKDIRDAMDMWQLLYDYLQQNNEHAMPKLKGIVPEGSRAEQAARYLMTFGAATVATTDESEFAHVTLLQKGENPLKHIKPPNHLTIGMKQSWRELYAAYGKRKFDIDNTHPDFLELQGLVTASGASVVVGKKTTTVTLMTHSDSIDQGPSTNLMAEKNQRFAKE